MMTTDKQRELAIREAKKGKDINASFACLFLQDFKELEKANHHLIFLFKELKKTMDEIHKSIKMI